MSDTSEVTGVTDDFSVYGECLEPGSSLASFADMAQAVDGIVDVFYQIRNKLQTMHGMLVRITAQCDAVSPSELHSGPTNVERIRYYLLYGTVHILDRFGRFVLHLPTTEGAEENDPSNHENRRQTAEILLDIVYEAATSMSRRTNADVAMIFATRTARPKLCNPDMPWFAEWLRITDFVEETCLARFIHSCRRLGRHQHADFLVRNQKSAMKVIHSFLGWMFLIDPEVNTWAFPAHFSLLSAFVRSLTASPFVSKQQEESMLRRYIDHAKAVIAKLEPEVEAENQGHDDEDSEEDEWDGDYGENENDDGQDGDVPSVQDASTQTVDSFPEAAPPSDISTVTAEATPTGAPRTDRTWFAIMFC